jgi:arsenite methyltransferase
VGIPFQKKKEDKMEEKDIKEIVKEGYAKIAKQGSSCCVPANSCCGSTDRTQPMSTRIGYSQEELKTVPEGANLGLGCGNPVALASLKKGDTVLDLGSGAGFDCFLASNKVGKDGKVIGVDMTPEMVKKARENATRGHYKNVEFRLGEVEKLPVPDSLVDVIISNCVINLSPNKGKVFQEAFRVLKPGGRLMISDIVLLKELPDPIKQSIEAYIGCVAGAIMKDEYLQKIEVAGFQDVRVIEETTFPIDLMLNDQTAKAIIENLKLPSEKVKELAGSIASIKVYGIKPTEVS